MPSQRPFFLSSFIAAFRAQPPTAIPTPQPQANKHSTSPSSSAAAAAASSNTQTAASSARGISSAAAAATQARNIPRPGQEHPHHSASSPPPQQQHPGRRRGSDSSSEGFREVIGAEKWYIGGRTAGGDEKFFKMGVVRRVRSNDGLSLDRLSL